MEPIPETTEADRQYGPFDYENRDLVEHLVAVGDDVQRIAPECVGMSLSMTDQGVTFTVVATDTRTALLDAVQFADDGPCQHAILDGAQVTYVTDDPLSEERWSVYAAATAAHGVRSTLSLPVMADDVAVAGFNLYGSTPDAFAGNQEALADLLGAWVEGAVTDADLGFGTLDVARRAPELLRAATRLAAASALLSQARGLTVPEAENRLRGAAVRAGVPLAHLADSVIEVLHGR